MPLAHPRVVGLGVAGVAFLLFPVSSAWAEDTAILITEPVNEVPVVLEPKPGNLARLAPDSGGTWHVLLTVSNSDFGFLSDESESEALFEALPSVGVFDTIDDRLQWTNAQFRCAVDTQCEGVPATKDGRAFGEEFLQLIRLYDESSGAIAHYVEHAYQRGQEPAEWLSEQETLTLAIPWAPLGEGEHTLWVGYTYLFSSDMEGSLVQFAPEAMAITEVTLRVPSPPTDDVAPGAKDLLPGESEEREDQSSSAWSAVPGVLLATVAVGLGAVVVWVVVRRLSRASRAARRGDTL